VPIKMRNRAFEAIETESELSEYYWYYDD